MNRKSISLIIVLLAMTCVLSGDLFFSPIHIREIIRLYPNTEEYQLKKRNIVKGSLVFKSKEDSSIVFLPGLIISHEKGSFECKPDSVQTIIAEYIKLPDSYYEHFYFYKEQTISDSGKVEFKTRKIFTFKENKKLRINGSKSISFSLGSNQNLRVNQSLYIKMNGELSENMMVEAQLSDNESPITPEGDTKELSSLDQVYIKIFGKQYELAFGDLDFEFYESDYMNFKPDFEGLRFRYGLRNEISAALAVTKAREASVNFDGQEGKQGPYYVQVDSRDVQIVAGTETVYLNGAKINRGDDYTIDYESGSITFTANKNITGNSFIQVDFQYSDENYRKNMYLAQTQYHFTDRLSVSSAFISRKDNKDYPIELTFTDEDKRLLNEAGDNEVIGSGITETDPGNGSYMLIDEASNHYQYVGNDSTGNYNIEFIQSSDGDYNYYGSGYYQFVGQGNGTYTPGKILPSPSEKRNIDLLIKYKTDYMEASSELLNTYQDKNLFSGKNDSDNNAFAAVTKLHYKPNFDKISPNFLLRHRFMGKNLQTFAENESAESVYKSGSTGNDSLNINQYYASLYTGFYNFITPGFESDIRRSGSEYKFNRYVISNSTKQIMYFPETHVKFEQQSEIDNFENMETDYDQIFGSGSYRYKKLKFSTIYDKKTTRESSETETGFKIEEKTYKIQTVDTKSFALETQLSNEQKFNYNNQWEHVHDGLTYTLQNYINKGNHQISGNFTHRKIKYFGTQDDNDYNSAEITGKHKLLKEAIHFSYQYNLKNMEFYPRVKELIYVGPDNGYFDQEGNDSLGGSWDYEYKKTGESELSIEVSALSNVSLFPGRFDEEKNIWDKIQFDSSIQLIENNTGNEKWKIYTFNPVVTFNEEYTTYGRRKLKNTLWYNIVPRRLSLNLNTDYTENFDQRYINLEKDDSRTYEAALQIYNVRKNNIEIKFSRETENTTQYNSRSIYNSVNIEVRTKFSRKFSLQSDGELKTEETNSEIDEDSYNMKILKLRERASFFLNSKSRIFAQLELQENIRRGSDFLGTLESKRNGLIIKSSISSTYRINKYTVVNFDLSTVKYPEEENELKFQIELRAEF